MTGSLRRLLAGIVDYAGTFPPARLSLAETVGRYREYRRGSHGWMLGKLVCSVEQLAELASLLNSTSPSELDQPIPLSLVVARNEDPLDAAASLQRDARLISGFCAEAIHRATIETVEVRLAEHDLSCLSLTAPQLTDLSPAPNDDVAFFFEAPAGNTWEPGAGELLAHLQQGGRPLRGPICGFKMRTGGVAAEAFPRVERVASVIAKCRSAGIRWKATAGLHQPLYHHDNSLDVLMHGFLNVACATVLATSHCLDESQIAEILREPSLENFTFGENGFRWRNFEVSNSQISASRREGFISFGSCSFDEPVEGLQSLDLL